MPPLLEVRGLHLEFRTGAGVVRVVDGVSHAVETGPAGEAGPVSVCVGDARAQALHLGPIVCDEAVSALGVSVRGHIVNLFEMPNPISECVFHPRCPEDVEACKAWMREVRPDHRLACGEVHQGEKTRQ